MYELSRVRLHGIGPKGARYQDVTLDMRCGEDGQTSPATVLFLENGGGKTVLVRLIFSVILPGKRQVVGTTSSKVLEKFVLGGDVAHVALEWRDVKTGRLLVTGKVSEWQGHVVSADSAKLTERWYTLRPTSRLDLATLPFTQDGRFVSLAGFRDRLYEAHEADPALQVVVERVQADWTEHLDSLRLDPELFTYQRKMNAGEGEAADAFRFKTNEAFVDWLLTAILPDEDLQDFGDTVTAYAKSLAERGDLATERDFVAGTLERLGPLVEAAGEKAAADDLHREAVADAERLIVALSARENEETEQHRIQAELLGIVTDRERKLEGDYKRVTSVIGELERLVAKLRWDEAKAKRRDLEDKHDAAKRVLAAWQATGIVVKYQATHEAAETVRAFIGQLEDEARPLLHARDESAQRFARLLLAMASKANQDADSYEAQAQDLAAPIRIASSERDAAVRRAAGAKTTIEQLDKNISAVDSAIRNAVSMGLLADGEDVADAATMAEEAAEEADQQLTNTIDAISELAVTRGQVEGEHGVARADLDSRARAAEKLNEQLAAALSRSADLTGTKRLVDLLGSDEVILDQDACTLLAFLSEAIGATTAERDALGVAAAKDQGALDALGSGGLLPPGEDVSSALDILKGERIVGWSGWAYLSQMPADEREQAIARHPHLIDGIVINHGDDLDRARSFLSEARLLPRAIIAVGTTATIADLGTEAPAGIGFIIPPNPAMYDEESAERERQEIESRQEDRHSRIMELETAIEADRTLRSKLTDWQRDFPAGALSQLDADCQQAVRDQETTAGRERELRTTLNTLDSEATGLRSQIPGLRSHAAAAKGKASSLRALADEHGKIAGWEDERVQAKVIADDAEQEASAQGDLAENLRTRQSEVLRAADSSRRNAQSYHAQMADVEGGGSVSEARAVPQESLESLRAAYRAAVEAYAKAEIGADLRAEEARRSNAESEARVALQKLGNEVREQATDLLLTSQGGDGPARSEATAEVQRQAEELQRQVTIAVEDVGRCESVYQRYQSQPHSVEPYGKPIDIQHGKQLVEAAIADRQTTWEEWEEVKKRLGRLSGHVNALERLIGDFGAVRESLSVIVPGVPGREAGPFRGDAEAARGRRDAVRESWNAASMMLENATRQVRGLADLLARHAADQKYGKADFPVRQQIISVEREQLSEFAAEWESALRPRLRVLTDELEQIGRHRSAMIVRLQGMVKHAYTRLRAAQRASRLPAELGDWSGLEFLRISFTPPDDATLAERLGEVIDEAAAKGKDKESVKRDGLSILLNGVRAGLRPKGVQVSMLKPDSVLRDERVQVSEIADVFSGGQLLTAAIVLYCTMAWLRSSERGQAQRPHVGVLFLDNPIGRASAGYLLELQLTVAKKLGVQLVYTTGLFDMNALSVFPLIVRLRNDADLRAGMKYLRVDEEIRRRLPDTAEDGTGIVTASRVFVRADGPA
jgi:hypothetical protein